MQKQENKSIIHACFSARFCIFIFFLFFIGAVALSMLYTYLSEPINGVEKWTDWSYASSDTARKMDISETDWKVADQNHLPATNRNNDYLFLKGTLPAHLAGTLYLKSYNSVAQIEIDGEQIANTRNHSEKFSGSTVNSVAIQPSESERHIEIMVFTPISSLVSVYFSKEGGPLAQFSRIPYFELIFAYVLLIVAVAVFFITLRYFKRNISIAIMLFFTACVLILDQYTAMREITVDFMFNLKLALLLVVFWFAVEELLLNHKKWSKNNEALMAVNVLYVLCILFLPYDIFMIPLIKAGVVLQIVNAGYCLLQLFTRSITDYSAKVAAFCLLLCANIAFWASILFKGSGNYFTFLVITYVFYALLSLISVRKVPQIQEEYKDSQKKIVRSRIRINKNTGVDSLYRETRKEDKAVHKAAVGSSKSPVAHVEKQPTKEEAEQLFRQNNGELYYSVFHHQLHGITAIYQLIADKCDGINHHLLHVAEYTRILCFTMGLGIEKTKLISDAALIHDIGKLCIDRKILLKTEALNDEEFAEITKHNIYGYQLLCGYDDPFLSTAANIAREHHERMDGSGYLGLCGEQICLPARIVSVADVFDALTSPRVYKRTWSFDQAYSYLIERKGTYFDSSVINALELARNQFKEKYRIYREQSDLAMISDDSVERGE